MSYSILQDWSSNKSNIKGRLILIGYRLAHIATINKIYFILFIPYLIIYRLLVEWILGCEIPYKTVIGKGLTLFHGHALVINDSVIIGKNCTLRHCTTIGNRILSDGSSSNGPIIGDNVEIGSNVCIIGKLVVGNNVKIGAGSVVVKDIPANSVAVGNPAKIIKSF